MEVNATFPAGRVRDSLSGPAGTAGEERRGKMRAVVLTGAFVAAAVLVACTPAPEVSGRADFDTLCASCHGAGGRGDGPAAAGLATAPAELTAIAARNGGVFDYAAVMSHIDGYTRGAEGQAMPEFGALLEGDTVLVDTGDGRATPTPARLFALAQYLATLQGAEGS
jgi:mono/diheme cytochrome c family protein